ncbi:DNA polymerase III subunit alpha [Novosphingopyxis sp. YJ-S2-01]|uniref:DNA polymerase III subunit alpha n=1 Tax=Novosphingopyxis sp. YJ-S2-01 TaxID=2794021 RepID=UPI0018DDA038|nr:DNA polymerase III subunit alpha [Novosphingopyxis sp. YJ-S2-01]MBH9538082.1 DNA polymerase III subunit alpha [Novosphingopyxis sp. YJ-S2-01]
MSYAPFVPLRVFSAYTMLEGATDAKAIGGRARGLGFPAVAVADRNGLYGAMAFEKGCRDVGVQPIIGAMLAVSRPGGDPASPQIDWLALYAQDEGGYDNLCALVSQAHLDRPLEQAPHVAFEALEGRTDGLIALTAGGEGALARHLEERQPDKAAAYCEKLEALFPGRLYIEVSRRDDPVEKAAEAGLLDLAYDRDIPLVATNPVLFSEPSFHRAHDAMLCIAGGQYVLDDNRRKSPRESWMKPAVQMQELFSDLPEALNNTLVVARRCGIGAPKRPPILPSIAGDLDGEAKQLADDARAGLEARLALYDDLGSEQRQSYFDRLDFEIKVIVGMGFPGYFLIVADFIKWAKANDIPVGPGRGSGAGSVVAWALTITDLDPIRLGLLFERFLNPERVSMPDFDIDFCETRRGEVIRYVQKKYGSDHVAQIITFGKLKARAVLRDTGRVLQMSYGQVDRLCKLVPNHPTDPWDLARARKGVAELRQEIERDSNVAELFELAGKLEGLPRHSSTHAAGVVIGDRPLAKLVPLYRDPRSDIPVTQFDMKFVETAGLVKFDFLGLKTLSVLQKAVQFIAERGETVDLSTLPLDDPGVFELLKRGETVGVFQLESEGMRRTLAAVRPTGFEDIIALVSLYRPGPMDNIPMFGRRKNGEETIEYPHPLLEPILKETYGIIVYQEQVMQAAQILAGYSLGEADLLRRAMGKKIQAEMDKQRTRFVEGCAANDIDEPRANQLFDLIDKFAGYGFNKSHAAAYALLAYQTAWLKAHYPEEFFAASMCFDMHQTDKLGIFVDDMRRLEIACLPPTLNESEAEFSVETTEEGGRAVRYALAGLKNVGEKAMETVVAERRTKGAFKSLDDLTGRIDPTLLNKRSIETLAAAGAFDALNPDRAAVQAGAETILAAAQSAKAMRDSGQGGLFGGEESDIPALRLPTAEPWSPGEIMTREKDAFGFYFSAHPVTQYRAQLMANGVKTQADLAALPPIAEGERRQVKMAALVENVRWRESRRGSRFCMVELSDTSGQFSASCFEEDVGKVLSQAADESACLLLDVELDMRPGDDNARLTVRAARPLTASAGSLAEARLCLELQVDCEIALREVANITLPLSGGRSELIIDVPGPRGRTRISLGRTFRVDEALRERLMSLEGISHVAELRPAGPPPLRLVS